MGLTRRSGSSGPPSSLPGETVAVETQDLLDQASFIRTPAVERVAFDPGTYVAEATALTGYLEGSRQTVTYFHLVTGGTDQRASILDQPTMRNVATTRYTRITGFELTLPTPWAYSYDPQQTESTVVGEAMIYPGFNPNRGDLFIAPVGDGLFGQFVVEKVDALSWRTKRCHRIAFRMQALADEAAVALLVAMATRTYVFDKQAFLGETVMLLEEDKHHQLQLLRQLRLQLARFYFERFYSRELGTLLHPSGLYDPYLVKYMTAKVGFDAVQVRPTQLYPAVDEGWPRTLWARLLDRHHLTLAGVDSHALTLRKTGLTTDVALTALLNRAYLVSAPAPAEDAPPNPALQPDYVLSTAFYTEQSQAMTPLETLVLATVKTRRLADAAALLTTHLQAYAARTPAQQFYEIPLYLFLIDVALATLTRPAL